MNAQMIPEVNLLALAIGVAMALPAAAQQAVVEDTALTPPPAAASSTPTSASSSMAGMDMLFTPGVPKSPHAPGTKSSPSRAGHALPAPPAPASSSGMQGMGMSAMPAMHPPKPAAPVELQHLHFGQMIGVRPKPGGLAGTMQGMLPMKGMNMPFMQGGSAPPDARSANYSDGYTYGPMTGLDMNDNPALGMVLLDHLEYVHSRDGDNGIAINGEAWYGKNFNKLWVKFEGKRMNGRLQDLRTEALWDHAAAAFWDTQVGVRHDFGGGPGRTWVAFGIEGLAPYWLGTQAELYVGQDGRTAARVQAEYEERLTQRWVLQPALEANFYGKDDPQRGIGSGLSNLDAGLRLRYEIRRELAPYVGVVWRQQFGRTADYARLRREPVDDLQFVAGFRIWF